MRVYLVDASIYIFRAYFSLPPRWRAANGFETHAVYGFLRWLLRLLTEQRPTALACAFDESLGSGFRHRLCVRYKSNRELPDAALAYQLAACREAAELLGIEAFASTEFEADDLIAALALQARRRGEPFTVLSRDKDLGQLLCHDDEEFWDYPDGDRRDRTAVAARAGVAPQQIPDLLALCGDPVDAIDGVPGIGRRSAAALLQRFGSCEALLEDPARVAASGLRGARRLAGLLEAHADVVRHALQLTRLRGDALAPDRPAPAWSPRRIQVGALRDFAARNGLGSVDRAIAGLQAD